MKTTDSRHGIRPSGRDLQSGSSLISSWSTKQSFNCEFRFNFSGMQQNTGFYSVPTHRWWRHLCACINIVCSNKRSSQYRTAVIPSQTLVPAKDNFIVGHVTAACPCRSCCTDDWSMTTAIAMKNQEWVSATYHRIL